MGWIKTTLSKTNIKVTSRTMTLSTLRRTRSSIWYFHILISIGSKIRD